MYMPRDFWVTPYVAGQVRNKQTCTHPTNWRDNQSNSYNWTYLLIRRSFNHAGCRAYVTASQLRGFNGGTQEICEGISPYSHRNIEKTPHHLPPPHPTKKNLPKFIPITLAEKSKCSCYINLITTSHTDLKTRHIHRILKALEQKSLVKARTDLRSKFSFNSTKSSDEFVQ
jgi:hypothetical protein